jgi:hypothetical protein
MIFAALEADGPPISMFSIASCSETSTFATVSLEGVGLTTTGRST